MATPIHRSPKPPKRPPRAGRKPIVGAPPRSPRVPSGPKVPKGPKAPVTGGGYPKYKPPSGGGTAVPIPRGPKVPGGGEYGYGDFERRQFPARPDLRPLPSKPSKPTMPGKGTPRTVRQSLPTPGSGAGAGPKPTAEQKAARRPMASGPTSLRARMPKRSR